MKIKSLQYVTVLFCTVLYSSCVSLSYTPKVSLDISPKTIQKTLQVEKLKNTTPKSDSNAPILGFSATDKEAMPADLDLGVTNAIVEDFANNAVFKQVSRRVENPDYILKGEIKRFKGVSQPTTLAKYALGVSYSAIFLGILFDKPWVLVTGACLPLGFYLGLPIVEQSREVELILYLYDKKDTLLATYIAKVSEEEQSSMYSKNKTYALPSALNKVFSKAVMKIREQLLADTQRLELQ